jgi:tetratricopeptide (TPR) repeat protein
VRRVTISTISGIAVACVCAAQTAQPTAEQILVRTLADLRGDDPDVPSPYKSLLDPNRPQNVRRAVSKTQAPAGYVSAAELAYKPPKKAATWASRGIRLARKGDHAGAASNFEKAVAIDPAFAFAHHSLGIEDVQLGRLTEGEQELRRTVQLDPGGIGPAFDLSVLLYRRGDFSGSEQALRRLLHLSDSFAPAHFLLGMILINQETERNEGINQLEYAARTIPDAMKILAQLRRE